MEYAEKLVGLEQGDEAIVIPAIILHDIGWSRLTRPDRLLIFNGNTSREKKRELQVRHQDEGVKLAGDILEKVDYPKELTEKILEIISGHDTRQGFISRDEGLVRDADKLWRFSKTGFEAGSARYKSAKVSGIDRRQAELDNPKVFFSETAKRIASEELEQ